MKHELMQRDDLTITFGDIVDDGLVERVPYYIARKGTDDFAQGSLPGCGVAKSFGFTEAELLELERIMRNNETIIYDRLRHQRAWAE